MLDPLVFFRADGCGDGRVQERDYVVVCTLVSFYIYICQYYVYMYVYLNVYEVHPILVLLFDLSVRRGPEV